MSKEKVEAKSLFDYIDNLQQAKDKLQNDYQNVVNIINELQQENKQLKENWDLLKEYINNQWLDDKGIIIRIKDRINLIETGDKENE